MHIFTATLSVVLSVSMQLTDGRTTVSRTRHDLGFRLAPSGAVTPFVIDLVMLQAALARLAPAFKQEAIDARPEWVAGKLKLSPGVFARKLDVGETAQRLLKTIQEKPSTLRTTVVLTKSPPVLTSAKLQGITGILGRMVTRTNSVAKRNQNIEIASQAIDGTLLSPGEVFSLNEVVGKRTQARGYRTATVFVAAELVPGVGGGVSQVTGTVFNAAALAGLRIVEVNPHSRPVSYLPLGRDATVAYGDKDLKFVNNTKSPIFVACSLRGTTLTATLFGATVTGRRVTLTPRVHSLSPGRINAELYRTIRQGGEVIAKERLLSHTYRWNAP